MFIPRHSPFVGNIRQQEWTTGIGKLKGDALQHFPPEQRQSSGWPWRVTPFGRSHHSKVAFRRQCAFRGQTSLAGCLWAEWTGWNWNLTPELKRYKVDFIPFNKQPINLQCLHLWFDMFCHCSGQEQLRQTYFRSFSFIRSPISLQICCELKLLSQFAFNLDIDSELISAEELARRAAGMLRKEEEEAEGTAEEMKYGSGGEGGRRKMMEGAREMMIKHHLFSWDLWLSDENKAKKW